MIQTLSQSKAKLDGKGNFCSCHHGLHGSMHGTMDPSINRLIHPPTHARLYTESEHEREANDMIFN